MDIQNELDDLREKLEALHAIAGERMGKDKWDSICQEGTKKQFLVAPSEDVITRKLVQNGDPFLIATVARNGEKLGDYLRQFDSDEMAAEWLIQNRDALVDMLDPEDFDQKEYESWKSRRNSDPGSMTEQQRYEAKRAKEGAYWARGRK